MAPQARYLAFHPQRPDELYAVSTDGLFKSLDRGENWSLVVGIETASFRDKPRLRFAPNNPERFYLVYGPELLETLDGGQSWNSIGDGLSALPYFNDVAVDPIQPQFLYAATPLGLYRMERQSTRTAVEGTRPLPANFALAQNYPNPFNPSTTIRYQIPTHGLVDLTIYNLAGQVVRKLVRQVQTAGAYRVVWDGRGDNSESVSSGVYFYRLRIGEQVQTRRMLLVK